MTGSRNIVDINGSCNSRNNLCHVSNNMKLLSSVVANAYIVREGLSTSLNENRSFIMLQ